MSITFKRSAHLNLTRNLVKRHKLVTHLDQFLGKEVEGFEFKYESKLHDDAWHPSGDCVPTAQDLYQIALDKLAEREIKPHSVSTLKAFLVGHFWHQLLQYAVVQIGFAHPTAIERQGFRWWDCQPRRDETNAVVYNAATGQPYDLKPFHWVTGSADVAPCEIPGIGDFVVDFKTMNAMDFRANGLPAWAANRYECQINIYMDFFDFERALIVGIQKDSPHEMKEIEFVRNQSLIDTIYDKWEFVSECLSEGVAPTAFDDEMFTLPLAGPIAQ